MNLDLVQSNKQNADHGCGQWGTPHTAVPYSRVLPAENVRGECATCAMHAIKCHTMPHVANENNGTVHNFVVLLALMCGTDKHVFHRCPRLSFVQAFALTGTVYHYHTFTELM